MASAEWTLPPGLVFLGTHGEPGASGPFLLLCTRCRSHLRRHEHQLADSHGPCLLREDVLSNRIDRMTELAIQHAGTGKAALAHRAWRLATRAFGQLAELGRTRRGIS